jgi:hypothetical protein
MPTHLEKALWKTLAYFAHFQFPLTILELQKWSSVSAASMSDIERVLSSSSWLRSHGVRSTEGFWGISDDISAWRKERIDRMTDALRKSRKLRRLASIMAWLPWVRLIAVCNSLAFSFTNVSSDIDLFIVATRGRIWSTRLLLTGALAFVRARPGEGSIDPLCLSFFVTDDALDMSTVKIGPVDPYMAMWIATLSPVIDRGDILGKIRAANGWLRHDLPHAPRVHRSSLYSIYRAPLFPDIGVLERLAERIQRMRLPDHLRTLMNRDTRVVVTDCMLKFHQHDRRADILHAWQDRCRSVGITL